MIRTKGEAGTGNIVEAVRHQRIVTGTIKKLRDMDTTEIRNLAEVYSQSYVKAMKTTTSQEKIDDNAIIFAEYTCGTIKKDIYKILDSIKKVHHRLPVVNFAAGGIATPADAAIMMQLGSDGVFVGSGIFKSDNPRERAKAIVEAVAHYNEPEIIVEVSKNLGEAMPGIEIETIPKEQRLQDRGW